MAMQQHMPIIPGLAGMPEGDEGGVPQGIEQLLAAIPDDELAALEEQAHAAADAGELDELLGDPEGGDEAEGDPGEEEGETPEEELAETDEEQASEEESGEEDPTPHVRAAEDATRATARAADDLDRLVEDAKEHEKAGVDVDALEEQLEAAQDAAEAAQKACDGVDSSSSAEDAAAAAKECQGYQKQAETALAKAKESIAHDADGAEEKAVPDKVRAMTNWAKSVAGIT